MVVWTTCVGELCILQTALVGSVESAGGLNKKDDQKNHMDNVRQLIIFTIRLHIMITIQCCCYCCYYYHYFYCYY